MLQRIACRFRLLRGRSGGVTAMIVMVRTPLRSERESILGRGSRGRRRISKGSSAVAVLQMLAAEVLRRARHAELRGEVALLKRPRHGG
jgi:hypothetical protein